MPGLLFLLDRRIFDMSNEVIYFQCPPVDVDRVAFVYDRIEAWARSTALSQLVGEFGEKIPSDTGVESLVEWLLNFSERWDFRRLQREAAAKDTGENARWLLSDSNLTPEQQSLIEESAKVLGLLGVSEPREKSYDYVLVLGGARLSCLLRPRLAAEIVKARNLQPKAVLLLASARPVAESERDATDTYAPDAVSEFDLINAGAEQSFQIEGTFTEDRYEDPQNVNNNWTVRKYTSDKEYPIISMSAPSSEPEKRRANSADTYEFFFSRFNVPCGSSLLLVTSQIYVPYQQLEAIRTLALPHEILIETVGFSPEWGGTLQGMIGPTNYLQETRSAIQAAHRFIGSFQR